MERTPPAGGRGGSGEPFAVRVHLFSSSSSLEIDLSKASGGRGSLSTTAEVKARVFKREGLPPDQFLLVFGGKLLEDSSPLTRYGITNGASLQVVRLRPKGDPLYPLAPLPSAVEPAADWPSLCTRVLRAKAYCRKKEIFDLHASCKEHGFGVHVWRVGKGMGWVEYIIEGPTDSFYHGGAFLLRVAFPDDYPNHSCQLRMMTPIYHPTVGPAGVVAVLGHDVVSPWSTSALHDRAVLDLVRKLRRYQFDPLERETLGQRLMADAMDEWHDRGEEWVRSKARLWTWHYATTQGRAYLRSGGRCATMAQLADLVAVDHQEVRTMLLIGNRGSIEPGVEGNARGEEEEEQTPAAAHPRELVSGLPRELVNMILLFIGSHRWPPPPAALRWEIVSGGDDGLPPDWRARLPIWEGERPTPLVYSYGQV